MCYGCHGSGKQLTKRGKVAREFFNDSMCVPVEDLKIGDGIKVISTDSKFGVITKIDTGSSKELSVKYCCSYSESSKDTVMIFVNTTNGWRLFFPGTSVRKYQTLEEKKEKFLLAMEYQSQLTVDGKLKKLASKNAL